MTKDFGPIFPRNIECEKPQGTTYKSPLAIFTITVFYKTIFQDLRGCWNHSFLRKKANLSSEKKLIDQFFS